MMNLEAALDSFGDRDVERAFDVLYDAIDTLQSSWRGSDIAIERLDLAMSIMLHDVCMAIPGLSLVETAPESERALAREAYASVLHVLLLAIAISRSEPDTHDALVPTRDAARALLDRLSPYVGRAGNELRAALTDGDARCERQM